MSETSNLGPIRPAPHSQSRHSLYTDHSNQSQDNLPSHQLIVPKVQQVNENLQSFNSNSPSPVRQERHRPQQSQQQHFPKKQQHLPKITNNPIEEKLKPNKLPHPKEETLPKQSTFNYRNTIDHDVFRNNLTTPISNNPKRYAEDEPLNNSQDRMLRSSQGGRWLRSKSLMHQKEQKTTQYLLRHYFKGGSVMNELVNRYIGVFNKVEKHLSSHQHQITLFEPLQIIKTKMETYLEKQLDLNNLKPERPSPEWTQEDLTKFFTHYQPVLTNKLQNIKTQKGITIKKYKNCVFFGTLKDAKKDGLGVLHYYSGRFYEGLFEDDYKVEGLQMDDNELYLGEFQKGIRSGQGILKTDESLKFGSFSEGQFRMGRPRQEANRSIIGFNQPPEQTFQLFKKGFQIEYSLFTIYQNNLVISKNNANDLYIGTVNYKDQKNGEGLQIFGNGDVYIGKYETGSPQGYGEYYWESGGFYRGMFVSGMRHGIGKWQMLQGDTYEGQYMNDKKNGKGTYQWKNGVKYVGYFQNDYRHGYGEMYWNDGKAYKGQWVNGIESNKTIKLQQHARPTNIPKNSFKTLQNNSFTKKKVPLDKLKSIYNPSNHIN